MSAPIPHDRLLRRFSLSAHLVSESALHVGSGETANALSASDSPIARDGRGRPYLPGSSLRGALRAKLESLLLGLGRLRVCNLFEKEGENASCGERIQEAREARGDLSETESFHLAWETSCAVCRLFGSSFLASRVRLADLPLVSDPDEAPVYVRDGVGLDRDLKTAAKGILYTFQAVTSGARFALRLDVENPEDHELGLLLAGLDLFGAGLATVGGKSSRGLGLARVEGLAVVLRTPQDFFAGGAGRALSDADLAAYRQAARRHYLEGGMSDVP
jgi:CRISPR-associated protein Csm3